MRIWPPRKSPRSRCCFRITGSAEGSGPASLERFAKGRRVVRSGQNGPAIRSEPPGMTPPAPAAVSPPTRAPAAKPSGKWSRGSLRAPCAANGNGNEARSEARRSVEEGFAAAGGESGGSGEGVEVGAGHTRAFDVRVSP